MVGSFLTLWTALRAAFLTGLLQQGAPGMFSQPLHPVACHLLTQLLQQICELPDNSAFSAEGRGHFPFITCEITSECPACGGEMQNFLLFVNSDLSFWSHWCPLYHTGTGIVSLFVINIIFSGGGKGVEKTFWSSLPDETSKIDTSLKGKMIRPPDHAIYQVNCYK